MSATRPDLNLLVVFDAVAKAGSVTRGAEKLALSQPAVSHALNRLRKLTGDPLFVRGRGQLTLTPYAESLKHQASTIIEKARAALAGPQFDAETTTRAFRIGVSEYATLTLAPDLAAAMRASAPSATLDFVTVGAGTLDALATGELDATFWGAEPPGGPFESAVVFEERFVAVTGRHHPLAESVSDDLSLDDYLAWPHARVSVAGITPCPVDAALRQAGLGVRVAVTAPGFASLLALLDDSPLIATLPSRLAQPGPCGRFQARTLPFVAPPFVCRLVWHRRQSDDIGHRWLRSLVARAISPA